MSRVTAAAVARALDPDRYEVVPVAITTEGRWLLASEARAALEAGRDALPTEFRVEGRAGHRGARPGRAGARPARPQRGRCARADRRRRRAAPLARPLRGGRDGAGALRARRCSLCRRRVCSGSALAMDKRAMKAAFIAAGLADARAGRVPRRPRRPGFADRVAAELGYPCFVKPANMGSSVGVSKAHDRAELDAAIETALTYDEWVLAEEAIVGREIEVGILGDDPPEASLPGEVVPGAEFYTYADKYEDDAVQLLTPAPLTGAQADEVRGLAVRAFEACCGEAMARVDFFLSEDRGLPRERGEHDPRVHAGVAVPADVGRERGRLPDAARSAHRPGDRPPRPPGSPGRPAARTDAAHRLTTGQVNVRVIPSTAWIWETTSRPRSSRLGASVRTITSYGPVTSSAATTPLMPRTALADPGCLADLGLDEHVRGDGHADPLCRRARDRSGGSPRRLRRPGRRGSPPRRRGAGLRRGHAGGGGHPAAAVSWSRPRWRPRLEAPLRAVVARKVGAPGRPELALGAVGPDGTVVLDETLARRAGATPSFLDGAVAAARAEVQERTARLTAVVTADEARDAGRRRRRRRRRHRFDRRRGRALARHSRARSRLLALPVGPADTLAVLRDEYDEVLALQTPTSFVAVGQWYRRLPAGHRRRGRRACSARRPRRRSPRVQLVPRRASSASSSARRRRGAGPRSGRSAPAWSAARRAIPRRRSRARRRGGHGSRRRARRGRGPRGGAPRRSACRRASASPSRRRQIQSSTREFSPYPGQRKWPSSSLRNQFTP